MESANNPRKRFDEKSLEELAASFKTQGVLAPLLVRELEEGKVAEAFLKNRITVGHALVIAKLPAGQQQEAFNAAFRSMWTSEGNTQTHSRVAPQLSETDGI